ncbi:MAG: VacJ family lipoprotein [Methylococcaceae bacterium]|jgi:phospholipid-binding lipoprotein MlaA
MSKRNINPLCHLIMGSLVLAGSLQGCASKGTAITADKNDPWQNWNRSTQEFNDDVDSAVVKPLAEGYLKITTESIDKGVTNFFSNLNDIGVTVNDLLQFKMLQAGMDLSRFVVNTTAGVVGIFDVAKDLDLPKHNEDFGQTLGVWGIPTGSYLVLPLIGPSTPRETVGLIGDALLNPLTYTFLISGGAASAASLSTGVVDLADTRAGLLTTESIVQEASVDRYEFIKSSYLQRRKFLQYDGKVPDDNSFDIDSELDDNLGTEHKNGNTTAAPSTDLKNPVAEENAAPVINNSVILSDPLKDSRQLAPVRQPHLDLYTPKE